MKINCNDCQSVFELDLVEIPYEDDKIEVGCECPYCHTWYHYYYTNRKLEERRNLLEKFKAKANRSDKDWQRYKRKKIEFQQAFDCLNPKPGPALAQIAPIGA